MKRQGKRYSLKWHWAVTLSPKSQWQTWKLSIWSCWISNSKQAKSVWKWIRKRTVQKSIQTRFWWNRLSQVTRFICSTGLRSVFFWMQLKRMAFWGRQMSRKCQNNARRNWKKSKKTLKRNSNLMNKSKHVWKKSLKNMETFLRAVWEKMAQIWPSQILEKLRHACSNLSVLCKPKSSHIAAKLVVFYFLKTRVSTGRP